MHPQRVESLSHARCERLAYIGFRLYFFGEVGRSDLISRLGAAPAGAIRDLVLYREIAPQDITFDDSNKICHIGQTSSPLLDHVSQHVPSALALSFGNGVIGATQPLLSYRSPTTLSSSRMDMLAPVYRAAHAKRLVAIRYHSVSSRESEWIIVSFTLVNTGLCWHVRTFDHKSGEFQGFVVTRTEAPALLDEESQAFERPDSDIQWTRIAELGSVPHPRPERPEVIRMDYGTTDGSVRMYTRAVVADYMLLCWSMDRPSDYRLKEERYRLWLNDPSALYGVENAKLAPDYQTPGSLKRGQGRRKPMAKTPEVRDKLARKIFEGSYQSEIPGYQRPYTWTIEQATELFDDLYVAMQNTRISGASSQYFLGSIVLIKNSRDLKSSVVDGQQRLSMLTMLFAVLRTVMPDTAEDITDFLYRKGKADLGEEDEYRLTAREEGADFFRASTQEPSGIAQLITGMDKLKDSHLRYHKNVTLLLERAKALPPAELVALQQFLANDCLLVVISTPDPEAVHHIFSVFNNRRLDLAPIDVIKAQVLGLIRTTVDNVKSRAYAKEWSRIESSLGRDAFGGLLSHIRSIHAKKKQKYVLVREFQGYVIEYKTPVDLVDKVVKPYAEVWDFVRNAGFEATEHIEIVNEYLSWLNRVDFKDQVSPALVYFRRFRQQPRLLAEFFQSLKRLTYFLLVTKMSISERIETYATLTKEIEPETFRGDLAALTTLALTGAQKHKFVAALGGDVHDGLPEARMTLVLCLKSLVRVPGMQLQDVISLEHVLPQTPPDGSDWIKWFPDEDERDSWTHRLANLVPLSRSKSSSANNYDFAKKKDVYFRGKGKASSFALTQEVRAGNEWTPTLLAGRQKRLVGVLKDRWSLVTSTGTASS